MSKPKLYGMKTRYIPNAKSDMRYRKKVYQRGRERAAKVTIHFTLAVEEKEAGTAKGG